MCEGDGLSRLRVRVAGHDSVEVAPGQTQSRAAQANEIGGEIEQERPQGHARQGLAQIIAAARKLQIAAVVRSGQFDDARLDAEEEVLYAGLVGQAVCAFGADHVDGVKEGLCVGRRDDVAFCEHDGVGFVGGEHGREEIGLRVFIGGLQHVFVVGWVRECGFGHKDVSCDTAAVRSGGDPSVG